MRCNTLILVEEECLQWLSECRLSTVGVSKLVWMQVHSSYWRMIQWPSWLVWSHHCWSCWVLCCTC